MTSLEKDARAIRRIFLRMHYENKASHIGSGLSSIDILAYLHRSWLRPQDRFILSKGHAASALYATLHHFGILSGDQLATYYQDGTALPAHPAAGVLDAIPVATGSLGHGLPIAAGYAFAHRHLEPGATPSRIACLLSDGECNEGSVWEAALFAAHHRLDNLVAIIDANGLQGFGRTSEVLNPEPFAEKWRAFGFAVREINGHDFPQLRDALGPARADPERGKPLCVIARTVKGKGVSYMEDRLDWHYLSMNEEQFRLALAGLDDPDGDDGGRSDNGEAAEQAEDPVE